MRVVRDLRTMSSAGADHAVVQLVSGRLLSGVDNPSPTWEWRALVRSERTTYLVATRIAANEYAAL